MMRHHSRARVGKDLVATRVIEVIVRVDYESDRQAADFANLRQELLRWDHIDEGVNYCNPIVSDNEACIATGFSAIARDRSINSLPNFLYGEIRSRSVGSKNEFAQGQGDKQESLTEPHGARNGSTSAMRRRSGSAAARASQLQPTE